MSSSDYRRIARDRLSGNWGIAALTAFLAALLGGFSTGGGAGIEEEDIRRLIGMDNQMLSQLLMAVLAASAIAALAAFVIGGVVQLGYCRFLLNLHDGRPCGVKDLFSYFSEYFGGGFCLRLLTLLYTYLWTLLFLIPGIIKSYSYAMAPFIMAEDPELGANECITRSRELMDGHKFDLFCLELSFIGWALLCVFTCGIGNLFLQPYIQSARAAFYRSLAHSQYEIERKYTYELESARPDHHYPSGDL